MPFTSATTDSTLSDSVISLSALSDSVLDYILESSDIGDDESIYESAYDSDDHSPDSDLLDTVTDDEQQGYYYPYTGTTLTRARFDLVGLGTAGWPTNMDVSFGSLLLFCIF